MSGNIVRIGDSVSCGDHAAVGSGDVHANGMPIAHGGKRSTTGHGCFHPTEFIGPWSKTVFVNGEPVAIKGKTKIAVHRCGKQWHDGVATSGSSTVSVEE
jgi:uncharacterized Zn-binding protein involved in type VI secretion